MFIGTYTVLITPFAADGSLDERALRDHVEWQIAEGIHGLIPNGSTGEFLCLTDGERRRVAEVVVEQAAGRVPVLIGTGAESTRDAISWTRHAESIGADGAMIIPPYYSRPDDEELVAHYTAIAQTVRFPIMIYNNPSTAGVDLLPSLLSRLAEVENLSYVKESTFDVRRVRDIIALCGDSDAGLRRHPGLRILLPWGGRLGSRLLEHHPEALRAALRGSCCLRSRCGACALPAPAAIVGDARSGQVRAGAEGSAGDARASRGGVQGTAPAVAAGPT